MNKREKRFWFTYNFAGLELEVECFVRLPPKDHNHPNDPDNDAEVEILMVEHKGEELNLDDFHTYGILENMQKLAIDEAQSWW